MFTRKQTRALLGVVRMLDNAADVVDYERAACARRTKNGDPARDEERALLDAYLAIGDALAILNKTITSHGDTRN